MSETATQTLARNPITAAALSAGDGIRVLDVSASGISKDAVLLLSELRKALCTEDEQANSSGNSTVTPGVLSMLHTEIVTVSGLTGTTRVMVLDTANSPSVGCRCAIRLNLPTTAGITVEFRNASSGGTLITYFVTDTSGDDKVAEFYYDGTAWQFLRFDSYATA